MTTFRQLLEQFEASARTRQAKGRRFEEFCEAYFQTDPDWALRFDFSVNQLEGTRNEQEPTPLQHL